MAQPTVSFDPDTFVDPWECGGYSTVLRENNTRNIRVYCRTISCPVCGPYVQMVRRFRIAFCLKDLLRGPHFFVKTLETKSKKLSDFLSGQARGPYVCIKQDSGVAVVISTRQFATQKGTRVDKDVILEKDLPEWLQAASRSERAISCSAEISALGKAIREFYWKSAARRLIAAGVNKSDLGMLYRFWDTDSNRDAAGYLAAVPGKFKAPRWESMNQFQQAQWLGAQLGQGGRIFKRGREFILDAILKAYVAAALAEKAGADLLWKFWVTQILLLPPVETLQDRGSEHQIEKKLTHTSSPRS